MPKHVSWAVLAALTLVLLPAGSQAAGHGKPGLWEVTMTMAGMPAMPQIPPEQLAKLKQMGVQMPTSGPGGRSITSRHCVTPQQAASDMPPDISRGNSGCRSENVRSTGSGMSADLVCTGEMQGKGKMQVSYPSDRAYSGSYSFQGTAGGQPANISNSFSGKWLAADCGQTR